MADNQEYNLNQPKLGMNLNSRDGELKANDYRYLVNGNIQSKVGDFVNVTNEYSNILCSKFKPGFKVINATPVVALNKTFFFLKNVDTGENEIGEISNISYQDIEDKQYNCDACQHPTKEDIPLEQREQFESCVYKKIVSAPCLDFSINHSIKTWVKIDDCNIRIYFTDGTLTGLRYIDYDYQKQEIPGCPATITDELDCDKIKVFKDSFIPKVIATSVASGGINKAGTYQFAICYSDSLSNPITHYFYISNPVPLFSKEISVITDYDINKSINLEISNLNTDFKYINLAVIKTINHVSSAYLVQTLSVIAPNIKYTYAGVDKNLITNLALEEIFARYPIYKSAENLAESNGYLFWYNLTQERVWNLQPVVNDLRLKWKTVLLQEGAYKDPIFVSKYRSYLRDEVYAFAIEFTRKDGSATARFHLPGPSKTEVNTYLPFPYTSVDNIITNDDVIQHDNCQDALNSLWQVYNLGTNDGIIPECGYKPITNITEIIDAYYTCNSYSFNEGETPPSNCYTASGCFTLEDCPTCLNSFSPPPTIIGSPALDSTELVKIQDAYTKKVCEYETNVTTPTPPEPPTVDGKYPTLITNTTCAASTFIFPQTNATCTRSSGVYTYGYLKYVSSPSIPASPVTSCNGGTGYEDNAVWFTFSAVSEVQAISIGTAHDLISVPIIIELYTNDCTSLGLVDCSTTGYLVNTSLTIGNNYYIKIYTPDPTLVNNDKGDYFDICVNTPDPIPGTCKDVIVPAVYVVKCTYKYSYTETKYQDLNCVGVPFEQGKFSYWESSEKYPCVPEVWGDLANTPIRHYKFPEFSTSPFYIYNSNIDPNTPESLQAQNLIVPIGVSLNIDDIKNALNTAVLKGLISEEEKGKICGYRIVRSNRNGNQSVLAKGLLYDVWKYKDNVASTDLSISLRKDILYPNYPFNDFNQDIFLSKIPVTNVIIAGELRKFDNLFGINHPNALQALDPYHNDKYTFHSANTHFNNPEFGTELKVECEQFGFADSTYQNVRKHAQYQYVGEGLAGAAFGFATAEASFEAIADAFAGGLGGWAGAVVGLNFAGPGKIFNHYYEWLDLLTGLAPYRNYAYYHVGIGRYLSSLSTNPLQVNSIYTGFSRRRLLNSFYLKNGIYNVKDGLNTYQFNNARRESSLYLNIDKYFKRTTKKDYSRWAPGCQDYWKNTRTDCNLTSDTRPISSYYASVKRYIPNQYGDIFDIEYIDTGYDGIIDWTNQEQNTDCDIIFGGDTFLNRFSLKRKHPFFIEERVGTGFADNADVIYSELYNVAYNRFFFNYPATYDNTDKPNGQIWGNVGILNKKQADFNFACLSWSGDALHGGGQTFGGTSAAGAGGAGIVGIPITWSITSSILYSGSLIYPVYIKGKMFLYSYGIISFIGESDYNVDMRHGENEKEKAFYPYVGDYKRWTQEIEVPIEEDNYYFYNLDYSKQNKENFGYTLSPDYSKKFDDCKVINTNRVIYSLQDTDESSRFDGNLIYLANNYKDFSKYGGKLKLVKGVENNVVLVIQEDMCSAFNAYVELQTNIGTSFIGSNELFAQKPQRYQKTDLGFGGTQHNAFISTEFGHFWVDAKRGDIIKFDGNIKQVGEKQAYNWLKENLPFKIIKDYSEVDIDNPFKYFGITLGYDNRFKRVFITKRDAQIRREYKDRITYVGYDFYLDKNILIEPTNNEYFINKSWTICYSPIMDSIISFNTFYPNYYVPTTNYFYTGVNYKPNDLHEEGFWAHLLTNKSYQVFYGHLHPFLFEYQTENKFTNTLLDSVLYQVDFQRFISEYDFYTRNDVTFNKALIYNQNQSTGHIFLIPKIKNNLFQVTQYPKYTLNNKEILVENIENSWRFNDFENNYKVMTQPHLEYNTNVMYKEVNPLAILYKFNYIPEKMRNNYFNIRLVNDDKSNYLINLKYNISKQTNSLN